VEVKAKAKYVHISPIKVRKLIGDLKGKPVQAGLEALKFMPQKGAELVEKVIRSAVANANQRTDLDVDKLVIQNITADSGPTLKRFRAKARGRGVRILKRTTHITVHLTEKSI